MMSLNQVGSFSEVFEENEDLTNDDNQKDSHNYGSISGLLTQHVSHEDLSDSSDMSIEDDLNSQEVHSDIEDEEDQGVTETPTQIVRLSQSACHESGIDLPGQDAIQDIYHSTRACTLNQNIQQMYHSTRACTLNQNIQQMLGPVVDMAIESVELRSPEKHDESYHALTNLHETFHIPKGFTEEDVEYDATDSQEDVKQKQTRNIAPEASQWTNFSMTSGETLPLPSQFISMVLVTKPNAVAIEALHHDNLMNNIMTTSSILKKNERDGKREEVCTTKFLMEAQEHEMTEATQMDHLKDLDRSQTHPSPKQRARYDFESEECTLENNGSYFDKETQSLGLLVEDTGQSLRPGIESSLKVPSHPESTHSIMDRLHENDRSVHSTSSDGENTLTNTILFSYPTPDPFKGNPIVDPNVDDGLNNSSLNSETFSSIRHPMESSGQGRFLSPHESYVEENVSDSSTTPDNHGEQFQKPHAFDPRQSTFQPNTDEFEHDNNQGYTSENSECNGNEVVSPETKATNWNSARVVSASAGILHSSYGKKQVAFMESDSDSSGVSDVSVRDVTFSQRTKNIQRQLGELAEVNIDDVVKTLMQSPAVDNEALRRENEKLTRKNKELSRMVKSLQQDVSRLNSTLEKEKKISSAMKSELDRLQPLVHAAVQISNRVQNHTIPTFDRNSSPSLKMSSDGSKKKKLVIQDIDVDSSSEDEICSKNKQPKSHTPRKALQFPSPKHSEAKKANYGMDYDRKAKNTKKSHPMSNARDKSKAATAVNVPACTAASIKVMPDFKDVWKFLKEKGWQHKMAPEPYAEKVYVPPNGNVKIGGLLGIDFFHGRDLFQKAEELGFYQAQDYESVHSEDAPISTLKKKNTGKDLIQSCADEKEYLSDSDIEIEADNTSTCGPSKVLTLRSATFCGRLLIKAAKVGDSLKFMRDLFIPMWRCLKDEQSGTPWKYRKSVGSLSRTWFFGAPEGSIGKDLFETEPGVVSFVLNEIKAIDLNLLGGREMIKDMMKLTQLLDRLENEALLLDGNALPSENRRQRRTSQISEEKCASNLNPKVSDNERKRKNSSTIDHSNGALKNVGSDEMAEMSNPSRDGFKATQDGIKLLLEMRKTERKYVNTGINEPDIPREPDHKKQKKSPSERVSTGSFHLSQSPDAFSQSLDSIIGSAHHPLQSFGEKKPFHGLSFFVSGLKEESYDEIRSLGGCILTDMTGDVLIPSNVTKKLFFISEPSRRRTLKYILAGALGVPMLHKSWVSELCRRYSEYKQRVTNGNTTDLTMPSPFDSELFTAYRLPIGLETQKGTFILQKARNAKKWSRPGCQNDGNPVFHGLNILLALDSREDEKKWSDIVTAGGANVIQGSSVNVDIIMTDSLCLPPHVLSPSSRIAKSLKLAYNLDCDSTKGEIPIIDLSWVIQCIIQRQRIDYAHNDNYYLNTRLRNLSTPGNTDRSLSLFSLKINHVRFEVMDLVRFGRNSQSALGRITAIHHQRATKKNKIEIQVMETHNNIELMDGGDTVNVTVDESELCGHVIMLSGKDFKDISDGWGKESNFLDLFVQMKP